MAALKWSLTALTALLSFAICSANKLTPPAVAVPPRPILGAPTPFEPAPPVSSGPVPSVRPGPTPSGPSKWISEPISSGPVPATTSGHVVKPPPKTNSEPTTVLDDSEIGPGWGSGGIPGCGGGGIPGCGGFGCAPAAPKNPYYCQPANCGGNPSYGGSGNGFTIYLGDHFPSSGGSDDEPKIKS